MLRSFSSGSGIVGSRSPAGFGTTSSCIISVSTADSQLNGTFPVSSSYATMPIA